MVERLRNKPRTTNHESNPLFIRLFILRICPLASKQRKQSIALDFERQGNDELKWKKLQMRNEISTRAGLTIK